MTNKEVFNNYGTEGWVVEEVLSYLLLEYKELVKQNNWQSTNTVGFVKNFLKEETLVNTNFAEKSKIENLEKNVIDVEVREIN